MTELRKRMMECLQLRRDRLLKARQLLSVTDSKLKASNAQPTPLNCLPLRWTTHLALARHKRHPNVQNC